MSEKPVVAIAMGRSVHDVMFAPQDLSRLRAAATVVGPGETPALEHVAPPDASVAFCRAGRFGERTLGERRCSSSDAWGAGAHASRQSCTRRRVSCR